MLSIRSGLAALLGALTLATAGCYAHSGYGYSDLYVESPPPPPPVEVVSVAPYPGAMWIEGHYYPRGRGYVWHPGKWISGRPGYRYVQHRIERAPDGRYRYRQGHWRR